MRTWETKSPEETFEVGKIIASLLQPGDVLLLSGSLGAGKTTLSKSIVHTLTGTDPTAVDSPTFTYVQEYDSVYHFDLYRLSNDDSFYQLGLEDYFRNDSICIIEWPERCPNALPKNAKTLRIDLTGKQERMISLEEV